MGRSGAVRILYGVVGEGMGHATRSRVVLEELVKTHEVQVVASGRAHGYLAERFPEVHRIWGLTIHYEGNAIRRIPRLGDQVKKATGRYWTSMERHKLYISENGDDLPEVRDWRWSA